MGGEDGNSLWNADMVINQEILWAALLGMTSIGWISAQELDQQPDGVGIFVG